jgi:hypothetical protein
MPNYYQNTNVLHLPGYEIYFTRFADSIINDHFNEATKELTDILSEFRIHERQIIQGGGGLSKITQQLAHLLDLKDWSKRKIESEHRVAGKVLTSESHEVDHYKVFERGNIGLEIEWNNKDPFYDRDLENFRKLHQIGELSVGIIITRGASLQTELYHVFERFILSLEPFDLDNLLSKMNLSDNAKRICRPFFSLSKEYAVRKITSEIYNSKYGAATTHMNKLQLRLNRGVGNPCPFILIGIGSERLINDETIQAG